MKLIAKYFLHRGGNGVKGRDGECQGRHWKSSWKTKYEKPPRVQKTTERGAFAYQLTRQISDFQWLGEVMKQNSSRVEESRMTGTFLPFQLREENACSFLLILLLLISFFMYNRANERRDKTVRNRVRRSDVYAQDFYAELPITNTLRGIVFHHLCLPLRK